jgi:hypothetical protein
MSRYGISRYRSNEISRVNMLHGRATAQAVNRRLPNGAARVRFRVRSCGISGGQSGSGVGFILVFGFP